MQLIEEYKATQSSDYGNIGGFDES